MLSNDAKQNFPLPGRIQWIGLRPGRNEQIQVVESAEASVEDGLIGDRFQGGAGAPRQVTLIQQEHFDVIARLLNRESIDPALMRRNIVVSGINLTALKSHVIQIGSARFRVNAGCPPCGKMEMNLGCGGYNAMRGHGGVVATVIASGTIRVGDLVEYIPE